MEPWSSDIEPPRLDHDDEEVEVQEEYAKEDQGYDAPEFDEAIRILEEVQTRARVNPDRFQLEHEADRYAEYVAMCWREPEVQDVGKVVFDRNHSRSDANIIRKERERFFYPTGAGEYLLRPGDEDKTN